MSIFDTNYYKVCRRAEKEEYEHRRAAHKKFWHEYYYGKEYYGQDNIN